MSYATLEQECRVLRLKLANANARLAAIMPLFEEARDALPAISQAAAKLHGVRLDLADRMDAVGDPARRASRASANGRAANE